MEGKRFLAIIPVGVSVFLVLSICTSGVAWGVPESAEVAVGGVPEAATQTPVVDVSRLAAQLRPGMTYHEIVRLLGAPSERKEMEAKRTAVWEYGAYKIFFREGKVVAWTSVSVSVSASAPEGTSVSPEAKIQPAESQAKKQNPADEETIRSLLGEIMDSSQGGGTSGAASGGTPAQESDGPTSGISGHSSDQDRVSLPPIAQQMAPY